MAQNSTFFILVTVVLVGLGFLVHQEFGDQKFETKMHKIVNQVNSLDSTWKATYYPNWMEKSYGYLKSSGGVAWEQRPSSIRMKAFSAEEIEDTPENFDSADHWPHCETMKDIRDQSYCGSCWAFGVTECMSDRACIDTGKIVRISPEDMINCCHACGLGCHGGWGYPAWLFFKNVGVVTGYLYGLNKDYCKPYSVAPCVHKDPKPGQKLCPAEFPDTTKCVKKCNPEYIGPSYEEDKYFASDVYSLSGEKHIMAEISRHGPVQTNFQVFADFKAYKSGVYQHLVGDLEGLHSVKIVGYGVEDGVKYWNVANSWGTNWGVNGFFKMIRGINDCNFEKEVVAGTVAAKK